MVVKDSFGHEVLSDRKRAGERGSGESEARPCRENFRGWPPLCPDDIVEHPPTTTGLVNVAEKRFLKLQKPLHDEGLRGFVLEKPH